VTTSHLKPPQLEEITVLLKAWRRGDGSALERLTPLVYGQLRQLARQYLRREQAGITLQATALVHEAYIRLVDGKGVDWQDRAHFFAVSAQVMRRILVDAARTRATLKRGGHVSRVDAPEGFDLDTLPDRLTDKAATLCALDDALNNLAHLDPRRATVVELRYFGGLSVEQTAQVLNVSPQTVMRDWRLARAWLTRELRR
jgi:RNA polymerase sigma factor (TIGR02999 family)